MRSVAHGMMPAHMMFSATYGTILEQKMSNRWGRYTSHTPDVQYPAQHRAARRNVGYTGEQLREIRMTHR